MSSTIDVTKPVTGSPTTASVRSNFAAAKSEIEALQTGKQDSGSYALTTTNLTAGTGLSGGGTLAANRTFSVNYGTVSGTAAQGNDSRINNGQTAYGWGDHAAAGYATGNATITLSGDVSGSGTTSIAVTVANDSHTHANGTITSLDAAKVNTGTLDAARIPSLNTSKITAGTFANARISQASVTQHQAAINAGKVDGKDIAVVSTLPGSPDANTIYFVTT